MASKTEDKKTPANVPAKLAVNSALPAHLKAKVKADAGKGVSTKAEDNVVPMIVVLQPLSPQVNKKKPEYIEGAEPGDIWLKNYSKPIVKGEKGFDFQPCYFDKKWVEWSYPRVIGTSGFIASHDERPSDAKEVDDQKNPKKKRWLRETENGTTECVETRYHSGIAYPDGPNGPGVPYVIPFASSGHTVSRQWMFMMKNKTIEGGEIAASFSCLYHLTTRERTNSDGTWSVIEVADGGWVPTEAMYDIGAQLHNAFASGEKKIEENGEGATTGEGSGDTMEAAILFIEGNE